MSRDYTPQHHYPKNVFFNEDTLLKEFGLTSFDDLNNHKTLSNLIHFKMDYKPSNGSKFATLFPYKTCYDLFIKKPPLSICKNNTYYPYVNETLGKPLKPLRFPFDLDIKDKVGGTKHATDLFNAFVQFWNQELFPLQPISIKDFACSRVPFSSQATKESIHAFIKPYAFENYHTTRHIYKLFKSFFIESYYSQQSDFSQYVLDNLDRLDGVVGTCSDFASWPQTKQATFYLENIMGYDKAIYGNGCLRTIYCGKKGRNSYNDKLLPCDPVTFQILDGHQTFETWKEYLITWIPNDCQFLSIEIPLEKGNSTNTKYYSSQNNISDGNTTSKKMRFLHPNFILDKLKFVAPYKADDRPTWIQTLFMLRNYLDDYKNIKVQDNVLVRKGDISQSKEYILNEENIFKLFLNFSSISPKSDSEEDLRKIFFSTHIDPNVQNRITLSLLNTWVKEVILDQLASTPTFTKNQYLTIKQFHQQYISDSELVWELFKTLKIGTIVAFQSIMGSGKSFFNAQLLLGLFSGRNGVYITNRRSLAGQNYKYLNQHGIPVAHYKLDDLETFSKATIKIVQLDSIGILNQHENLKKATYDLYLDETSNLLSYLTTSTTFAKKSIKVILDFFHYVRYARNIICTDADIRQEHLDFLSSLREETTHKKTILLQNSFIGEENQYKTIYFHHYPSKTHFLNESSIILQFIVDKYNEGNGDVPIIINLDSLTLADQIHTFLLANIDIIRKEPQRVKYYSSTRGNDQDLLFDDLAKIWTDIVLFTPSITTGVDFNHPAIVISFFTNCSISPRVFIQQSARVRQPTEHHMVLLSPETCYPPPDFIYSFDDYKIQQKKILKDTLSSFGLDHTYLTRLNSDQFYIDAFEKLNDLIILTNHNNILEKIHPHDMLRKIYINRGYEIIPVLYSCPDNLEVLPISSSEVNPDVLVQNIRQEIALHHDLMFDPELEEFYHKLWKIIVQHLDDPEDWGTIPREGRLTFIKNHHHIWDQHFNDKDRNRFAIMIDLITKDIQTRNKPLFILPHNPMGMLNFMSDYQKIFLGIAERAEFLKKDLISVACEDDHLLWNVVSNEKEFHLVLKIRFTQKDLYQVTKTIKGHFFKQNISYILKDYQLQYKHILDLENFMNIEDRYKVDKDYIVKKVKDNVVLTQNSLIDHIYLQNVCNAFGIKFNKIFDDHGHSTWYDLYTKYLKVLWDRFFGNLIVFDKKYRFRNVIDGKTTFYSAQVPIFKKNIIEYIEHNF